MALRFLSSIFILSVTSHIHYVLCSSTSHLDLRRQVLLTTSSHHNTLDIRPHRIIKSQKSPLPLLPSKTTSSSSSLLRALRGGGRVTMSLQNDEGTTFGLFVHACGQIAQVASIICFLAPIPTINSIARDKNVGTLPLLPYSSMIANCFIWVVYGLIKQESKIYTPNGIGLCLSCYYFYVFTSYLKTSSSTTSTLPGTLKQHYQGTLSIIAITTLIGLLLSKDTSVSVVGTMGVTFCMIMFGSPLAALKVVIQTKSAKSIPLPFTVATIINCLAWTVLGWFEMNDINIYLPNIIGLLFGLAQVFLKILYGSGSGGSNNNEESSKNDENMTLPLVNK